MNCAGGNLSDFQIKGWCSPGWGFSEDRRPQVGLTGLLFPPSTLPGEDKVLESKGLIHQVPASHITSWGDNLVHPEWPDYADTGLKQKSCSVSSQQAKNQNALGLLQTSQHPGEKDGSNHWSCGLSKRGPLLSSEWARAASKGKSCVTRGRPEGPWLPSRHIVFPLSVSWGPWRDDLEQLLGTMEVDRAPPPLWSEPYSFVYICMCIHVHICIYIHIYMYVYRHMYSREGSVWGWKVTL